MQLTKRELKNLKQREQRAASGNAHTKKYEKTKPGKIMRTYRNMLSRVRGISKAHLYAGKPIIGKQDFYEWAIKDADFNTLYDAWVLSGFNRKTAPSIDRVNSGEGYIFGNIRWITHSENSRLGNISKRKQMGLN